MTEEERKQAELVDAGEQLRAAMATLELAEIPEPPPPVEPVSEALKIGLTATQKTALFTALLSGVFGTLQSMRGADAEKTTERFDQTKSKIGETYEILAHNQNVISGALTKLSRRNIELKKRILKLERMVLRLEGIQGDDESPLLIFGRETPKKIIRIKPLPIFEGPLEPDE